MLDIGPGGAVACSAMPQTEILIHIVLDAEEQAARTVAGDVLAAAMDALPERTPVRRAGIETRALADPPEAADAAQATAPGDAPISADLPAGDPPITAELPGPAA